jgi:hypothetical protein
LKSNKEFRASVRPRLGAEGLKTYRARLTCAVGSTTQLINRPSHLKTEAREIGLPTTSHHQTLTELPFRDNNCGGEEPHHWPTGQRDYTTCQMNEKQSPMRPDILVPEEILSMHDGDILSRVARLRPPVAIDLHDPRYGTAFRRYLLFTHWPFLIQDRRAGDSALLYNQYYWFIKFMRLFEQMNGPDAGLKQQTIQILERSQYDIDWAMIEQIERLIEQELT